jgi:hypothetical protein
MKKIFITYRLIHLGLRKVSGTIVVKMKEKHVSYQSFSNNRPFDEIIIRNSL